MARFDSSVVREVVVEKSGQLTFDNVEDARIVLIALEAYRVQLDNWEINPEGKGRIQARVNELISELEDDGLKDANGNLIARTDNDQHVWGS